ncbi:hypothetical protein O6H91_01G008400 [Diphasiastrum complanatum]|nr:hypothetical protein O6H91_01G008400 [Diphasiastrum complanatum]
MFASKLYGQYDWASLSSSESGGLQIEIRSSSGETCAKSMGGCNVDQEFLMDSEINRRILAQRQYYISYSSLSADRTPCPPRSGRSYYTPNCNTASGRPNPYRRGCSRITRCARDTG